MGSAIFLLVALSAPRAHEAPVTRHRCRCRPTYRHECAVAWCSFSKRPEFSRVSLWRGERARNEYSPHGPQPICPRSSLLKCRQNHVGSKRHRRDS